MTAALEARGVGMALGKTPVLDWVDLDLHEGQVTALIGPNGAGKSTLVRVLSGLSKPQAGTVTHEERIATALQAPALARRSVEANIRLAQRWWGVPRHDRERRCMDSLVALGVDQLASRRGDRLSGGEARRVHLARVLALDPKILLLDEPFAGLDPATRADLLYDTSSVLRSDDRATLVIVHDRAEAWALADRVAVLLDGKIAAEGTPSEIFERPSSAAVAEFVGFVGRQKVDGGIRYLRPADVLVDPNGPVEGTVRRRIPVEEGVRLELETPSGVVVTVMPAPGPEVGATVRVRIVGGTVIAAPIVKAET